MFRSRIRAADPVAKFPLRPHSRHQSEHSRPEDAMRKLDPAMMPSRRRVMRAAAALAAGIAAPAVLRVGAALAAYPDRPVRIVVANSPGGPSDIVARMMAAALEQSIGSAFIVE